MKQSRHPLGLQGRKQLSGIHVVILNGVPRPNQLRLFQTPDRADHLHLYLCRHAGREPIDIDLSGVESFRLQKNLVPRFIRKFHHLVLKRRTVPGTYRLNLSTIERRPVQVVPDDLVGTLIAVGDEAGHLGLGDLRGAK